MDLTDLQIRQEDLRHAVLMALYRRRQGAHRVDAIHTIYLPPGINATRAEVVTALTDLERFHRVESAYEEEHGSIKVWQITGEGITFVERWAK